MADSTVAALTASDALTGPELFYADGFASAAAADVKVTATQIKAWATNGLTITATTGTFTLTNAKTFSVTGTLTLAGTDGSTLNIGTGGTLGTAALKATGTSGNTVPLLDGVNTWSGAQTVSAGIIFNGSNLLADAANAVAMRNGTNAQTFNIYSTWTDAANNLLGGFQWSGGRLYVQTYGVGTSAAGGALALYTVNAQPVEFWTGGTERWQITSSGHLLTIADNNYDIGASGATRPRTAYLGTSAVIGGVANGTLGLLGISGSKIEILILTEETTIAAAATTDTAIQIPANAIVLAVQVRTTTVIPTAATYTVTGTGSSTTFNTAAVSAAATSTDPGTAAGAYYNATAQTIRITPNAQPADNSGRVRVTIRYILSTPPTS